MWASAAGPGMLVMRRRMDGDAEEEAVSEPSRSLIWPVTQDHSWSRLHWIHTHAFIHTHTHISCSPSSLPHVHLHYSFTSPSNRNVKFPHTRGLPGDMCWKNNGIVVLHYSPLGLGLEKINQWRYSPKLHSAHLRYSESFCYLDVDSPTGACLFKETGRGAPQSHWDKGVDCQS